MLPEARIAIFVGRQSLANTRLTTSGIPLVRSFVGTGYIGQEMREVQSPLRKTQGDKYVPHWKGKLPEISKIKRLRSLGENKNIWAGYSSLFLGDSLRQNACTSPLRLGLEKKLSFVCFILTFHRYARAALSIDPANRMLLAVRVQKGGGAYWRWLSSPTQNEVEWINHSKIVWRVSVSLNQSTAPPKNTSHLWARA